MPTGKPSTFLPTAQPSFVFDGKDLNQFDTFLRSDGLNSDPNHVFTVEHGVVHVSGTEFGYIITKQEFQNYYLKAEFKWGKGTFRPRAGPGSRRRRLYNIQEQESVAPNTIEFQINEGCTGDFWMTDGAALTGKDGPVRVTGPEATRPRSTASTKARWKMSPAFAIRSTNWRSRTAIGMSGSW